MAWEALVDRLEVYRRIAQILLRFSDEISAQDKKSAVNVVFFTMITAPLYKVLCPHNACYRTCIVWGMIKMLMLYLSNAE